VTGTAEQKALAWSVLDQLPMHHAVQPTSIQVVPEFQGTPGTLGNNKSPFGAIRINQGGYGMDNPDDFQGTVSHEVGHSVDHRGGLFSVFTHSRPSDSAPFGSGPNVSDYAGTNPKEDFAESYESHFQNPEQLHSVNAQKDAVMHKLDKPGFLDHFVDRPAYRETGKWIGQQFESCPDVRTGMEIARQGSIAFLGIQGVGLVTQGVVEKRGSLVAQGLLQSGLVVGGVLGSQVGSRLGAKAALALTS